MGQTRICNYLLISYSISAYLAINKVGITPSIFDINLNYHIATFKTVNARIVITYWSSFKQPFFLFFFIQFLQNVVGT